MLFTATGTNGARGSPATWRTSAQFVPLTKNAKTSLNGVLTHSEYSSEENAYWNVTWLASGTKSNSRTAASKVSEPRERRQIGVAGIHPVGRERVGRVRPDDVVRVAGREDHALGHADDGRVDERERAARIGRARVQHVADLHARPDEACASAVSDMLVSTVWLGFIPAAPAGAARTNRLPLNAKQTTARRTL